MDTKEFANYVLSDWDDAMDRFYTRVQRAAHGHGLTDEEVRAALLRGYGDEVADGWTDWSDEEN